MEKQLQTPVRLSSLAKQIEDILKERIASGFYSPKSQLPAEDELAREFKVSRATVRSALSSLTAVGKVVRIHGVGTFVSQMPHMLNPLDQLIDFQELFARHARQPQIDFIYCAIQEAGSELARMLDLPTDGQVLVSEKVFFAEDAPSIYCVNSLPVNVFPDGWLDVILKNPASLEPLFSYLEDQFGLRVAYMHSRVYAVNANQLNFHASLPYKNHTPVLVLDEVAYTDEGRPIFHTYEYHPERRMNFELIRKRAG